MFAEFAKVLKIHKTKISNFESYWKNQCNALAEKWDKGEISDSEYYSKSPYGYECWSCSYCGKWTGSFKYR